MARDRIELQREDFMLDGDWAHFLQDIGAIHVPERGMNLEQWNQELERQANNVNRVSFDRPKNVQADLAEAVDGGS